MLAEHFSLALGFSKQGLVRAVSSASLFPRCSLGLLAVRNLSRHPRQVDARAVSGRRFVPRKWKAGHHFVGMVILGKVFFTKTLVLETSAGSGNRP